MFATKPKRLALPKSSHYVALVIEDAAHTSGGGPARVCVQRRLKRQAATAAAYAFAARRPGPRTAPAPPQHPNAAAPAHLHLTPNPLELVDVLNSTRRPPTPEYALAACVGPFRSHRDAACLFDAWTAAAGQDGCASVLLSVGYALVAGRRRRRYAADLGLVYGDVEAADADPAVENRSSE